MHERVQNQRKAHTGKGAPPTVCTTLCTAVSKIGSAISEPAPVILPTPVCLLGTDMSLTPVIYP